MMELDRDELRAIVEAALREDLGREGDITTDAVIPYGCRGRGCLVARQDLVVAGLPVAREVFGLLDLELQFEELFNDGAEVEAGDTVALVSGAAAPILRGERTALNFLMRMSGIATLTRSAVNEVAHTKAKILDTRKTAPGLRLLDKYSVAAGGAVNHRIGLYDAVLIKDTHLEVAASIERAVAQALARGCPPEKLTVEVSSLDQLEQAIAAGAGRALLDNMNPEQMRRAVEAASGRIVLEASGGLRPGRLAEVAETGVDYLSLGWLTHSAPAADLAMDMEEFS
jgi:nicotinate-nucleotide pyrophosphorylase (carboxylating)